MVKKIFMITILILMVCFALSYSGNIPNGTSDYGIKFPYTVRCIGLTFCAAAVSVEFFYDGVQVDSFIIRQGEGGTYTIPCDSVNIIRGAATGGLYVLGSPSGDVCPDITPTLKTTTYYSHGDTLSTPPMTYGTGVANADTNYSGVCKGFHTLTLMGSGNANARLHMKVWRGGVLICNAIIPQGMCVSKNTWRFDSLWVDTQGQIDYACYNVGWNPIPE